MARMTPKRLYQGLATPSTRAAAGNSLQFKVDASPFGADLTLLTLTKKG
jgi:hypothetical protein